MADVSGTSDPDYSDNIKGATEAKALTANYKTALLYESEMADQMDKTA